MFGHYDLKFLGIPNMNENLSSNPEKNQSFTILPPTSPNEHGKENNEHNNLSSTPTLPAVLPKIRGTPHTPQPILFEDKQGSPVVRKNFESVMRKNSMGSLNVKKNPVRRPQLLDSLNLDMSAKEDSVKNQDGEKPWYFVDIDGDAKLRSWPKPSVGIQWCSQGSKTANTYETNRNVVSTLLHP